MGRPRLDKLKETHFRCACGHVFESEPARVDDRPDWPWHPFEYFAACPECGDTAPQDPRYRGLLKAHAFATGPVTEEGKAASAANLAGHPTPEETKKTRFNAITHGLTAKVANFYPAKPGSYERCKTCSYYGQECVENPPSTHKNPDSCLSRVELFMQHRMAFESGDAGMLSMLRADLQAGVQAIINDILLDITQRGVTLVAPEWKINPATGKVVIADYIDADSGERCVIQEVKPHPLLKILIEFINKNNLSLEDMGMTPKVAAENDLMAGFLDNQNDERESAEEFRRRIEKGQDDLMRLITNSYGNEGEVIEAEVVNNNG